MTKRKPKASPAICSQCGELIEITKVLAAMDAGKEYVHGCGRRLVKAK